MPGVPRGSRSEAWYGKEGWMDVSGCMEGDTKNGVLEFRACV